jgi:Flp pilus assembly protein TadG
VTSSARFFQDVFRFGWWKPVPGQGPLSWSVFSEQGGYEGGATEQPRIEMSRNIWKNEEGSALVELAVSLPAVVLLLVGMMEFALLLFNQQVITLACREGARYGMVSHVPRRTKEEITAVVSSYTQDHLVTFGSDTAQTTVDPDDTSGAVFGDDLTVTVTFHYDFLVLPNFIGTLFGGTTLHAQMTMKYE